MNRRSERTLQTNLASYARPSLAISIFKNVQLLLIVAVLMPFLPSSLSRLSVRRADHVRVARTILGSRQLKIVTLLVQSTTFAVSVGCPRSKGQYRAAWPASRYWQMHF
jgi:hypothetical protein